MDGQGREQKHQLLKRESPRFALFIIIFFHIRALGNSELWTTAVPGKPVAVHYQLVALMEMASTVTRGYSKKCKM